MERIRPPSISTSPGYGFWPVEPRMVTLRKVILEVERVPRMSKARAEEMGGS